MDGGWLKLGFVSLSKWEFAYKQGEEVKMICVVMDYSWRHQ